MVMVHRRLSGPRARTALLHLHPRRGTVEQADPILERKADRTTAGRGQDYHRRRT